MLSHHIGAARTIISTLSGTTFMNDATRTRQQIFVIDVLQCLAYHDADHGPIRDIAQWCSSSWLHLVQHHPDSPEILSGIGHSWLLRAQPALARVSEHDQTSGSSDSSGSEEVHGSSKTCDRDTWPGHAQTESQNQRRALPEYVEARGLLEPAIDYLNRAVGASRRQGRTPSGDLLTLVSIALDGREGQSRLTVTHRLQRPI